MITVNFIRTNNDKVCVEVEEGTTLIQAAKQAELKEIPADCGGNMACATCHIHLSNAWTHILPIKENGLEQSLLEYERGYIPGVSRLSCQIQLTKELDNLTVRLRDNELL